MKVGDLLICKKEWLNTGSGLDLIVSEQYKITNIKTNMIMVSDLIQTNSGLWLYIYGSSNLFYSYSDYFYTKSELRSMKLKRIL